MYISTSPGAMIPIISPFISDTANIAIIRMRIKIIKLRWRFFSYKHHLQVYKITFIFFRLYLYNFDMTHLSVDFSENIENDYELKLRTNWFFFKLKWINGKSYVVWARNVSLFCPLYIIILGKNHRGVHIVII